MCGVRDRALLSICVMVVFASGCSWLESPRPTAGSSSATPWSPDEKGAHGEPSANLGAISGTVMEAGHPIAGCKVRVVKMATYLRLAPEDYPRDEFFEAVAGSAGEFVIRDVPEGTYRMLWAPPGSTNWIRRLSGNPDLVVKAQTMTRLPPLDMRQSPLD